MASPNYLDRISKDTKEKDAAAKKQAAEKAAINMQAAVYQAKTELANAKAEVESAKEAEPFDVDGLLEAVEGARVAQETYDTLKSAQKELFEGLISND